jgi:heme-degrading monooxygenase HmoA
MAHVIMIGEVEDAAKWEERFRSHRGLFAELYGAMGVRAIHFTTTDDGRFALHSEPLDAQAWLDTLDSDEIKAAMAEDGVKRETVQVHILDKTLSF